MDKNIVKALVAASHKSGNRKTPSGRVVVRGGKAYATDGCHALVVGGVQKDDGEYIVLKGNLYPEAFPKGERDYSECIDKMLEKMPPARYISPGSEPSYGFARLVQHVGAAVNPIRAASVLIHLDKCGLCDARYVGDKDSPVGFIAETVGLTITYMVAQLTKDDAFREEIAEEAAA